MNDWGRRVRTSNQQATTPLKPPAAAKNTRYHVGTFRGIVGNFKPKVL